MNSIDEGSRVIEGMDGFPNPHTLHNAIVFIRAAWSAYSKASFENLIGAVKEGLDDSWKIIVLDTDHLKLLEFIAIYGEFPSTGGWGEAFWIKAGTLCYRDRGYYNEPLTKLLWRRIQEFSTVPNLDVPEFSSENEFTRSVLKNSAAFPTEQLEIYDLDCREIDDLKLAVIMLYHMNRAESVVTLRSLAAKELAQVLRIQQ